MSELYPVQHDGPICKRCVEDWVKQATIDQQNREIKSLNAEIEKKNNLLAEQLTRLRVLTEGTDGSIPAIITISRLRDEIEAIRKIVNHVQLQTHLCDGRDCIGYYQELMRASDYQCDRCAQMRNLLSLIKEEE